MEQPTAAFPVQHVLTQTIALPASTKGRVELMTIWAGQSASLVITQKRANLWLV